MSTDRNTKLDLFLGHRYLFFVLLAIDLAIPFCTHFYPTLDGPSHLYNAQLVKQLLQGNDGISLHFMVNRIPVPNWFDHALLALLLFAFPAWIAEKVFVCLYVAAMALGARRLLRIVAPGNENMALLVFPMIHALLFNFGFFNFSWGLALVLWTVAWAWEERPNGPRRTAVLVVLATVTYFCNILAFALSGCILSIAVLAQAWSVLRRTGLSSVSLHTVAREVLPMLLAYLPGTIMFLLFQQQIHFDESDPPRPFAELVQWLLMARPLVSFNFEAEEAYTWIYAAILGCSLLTLFLDRRSMDRRSGSLFLAAGVVLLLYFLTPDNSQAGMMSDRYCILFYLTISTALAAAVVPRRATHALALAAAILQFGISYWHWSTVRTDLDVQATAMNHAADHIPANATVYPVDLSANLLHGHIQSYLGADKPLVLLTNYEPRLGWFPIAWNPARPVQRCLGTKVPYGVNCTPMEQPSDAPWPDAVVVHGDVTRLELPEWSQLRRSLTEHYAIVHRSSDGAIVVYTFTGGFGS